MSTTLSNCEQELSKQLGDWWASNATSTASNVTLVDTSLKAKLNDWITDDTYLQMVTMNGAANSEESRISALNSTSGTLTFLALTGNTVSGDSYRVHRLFTASEKRRALINACKVSFPFLHENIKDESKTTGDWLIDGGLEIWSSTSALNYWTTNAVTLAQVTTNGIVTRGKYCANLTTAAGDIYQGLSKNPDLQELTGQTVTFKGKLKCNVANCAFLQITDGITTTNSGYAGTTYPSDRDFIEVTQTINSNPTEITFKVIKTNTAASLSVDDLRVIGATKNKIYIGDLNLAQNTPMEITYSSDSNIFREPWLPLRNWDVDTTGWLFLKNFPSDYRLRIRGIGYLDFKVSGVVNTSWSATVNIDDPQTQILVANAAVYLCSEMSLPTETSGTSKEWKEAKKEWINELNDRKTRFGMSSPNALTQWG